MSSGALSTMPSVRNCGRVGIVGLGLIGGSFAKALHEAEVEVYAANRTRSTLEFALVETIDGELTEAVVPTCELIILCSYPASCVEWLRSHASLISEGAIVIDACGIKSQVCADCFAIAEGCPWNFCGCHPMAGSQYSGFGYARADLFEGAPLVFCPPTSMDDLARADMLGRIKQILAPCNFGIFTSCSPQEHDAMIAYTSQLPHVIANGYVKSPTNRRQYGFTGGSYRDLTRVAHLNPEMWSELFCENAQSLSFEIGVLIERLQEYKDAIDAGDRGRLEELLAAGDRIKREQEGSNQK